MNAKLDLNGVRFGRLLVLSPGHDKWSAGRRRLTWLCRCDCGALREIVGASLTAGATKSCGCFQRDNLLARNITHGQSRSRAFRIWAAMLARCNNKNNKAYLRYGGRGIKVCARWHVFSNFLLDMGQPGPGLSIDRIDSTGDYEPSNCRWATNKEQCRNRSNTVFLEFNGRRQPLGAWADELGVPYKRLQSRFLAGWPADRILKEPPHNSRGLRE
ncbi:MAG: hypothetical protein K0S02_549 [Achromobacter mucicolens]|jgi:hypothetical protein|nr:hypothetical protein [Achromobacter mucicolens]